MASTGNVKVHIEADTSGLRRELDRAASEGYEIHGKQAERRVNRAYFQGVLIGGTGVWVMHVLLGFFW